VRDSVIQASRLSRPVDVKISTRPYRDSDEMRAEERRLSLPVPGAGKPSTIPPSCVVLEGKYRLVNELGRGAMGTVFLAEDRTLKRQVAVKFLLPELVGSEDCAERFQREAVAMAAIRNENVAQIFSFGDENNAPYFVMEYLDGETVENLIDSHNRRGFYIPLDDAIDIAIQSLSGLAAIHRAGAIHRDIKPANIMLTSDPMRAVIMDFGLVRDVRFEDDMRTLAGTPAYIAPELVEGRAGADGSHLADIYSMGVSIYELLTGSIPFGGDSWVEILQKHIAEMPVYPSVRRPGLPDAVDEVVLRAMSKDPRERFQSCQEFIDDLARVSERAAPRGRRPSVAPVSRASQQRTSTPRGVARNAGYQTPNRAFRSTPSGRGRLLVADPDPDFRALVHGAAKSAVPGCRVHSATDGAMTLQLVDQLKPHVLLLDLNLPAVNGFEVVATLRGEGHDDLRIIVVSSRGGTSEVGLLAALDVHAFLPKPVDSDDLAQLLRPLLEQRLSRPSTASSY
jgi:serine/threonine-protein kinase